MDLSKHSVGELLVQRINTRKALQESLKKTITEGPFKGQEALALAEERVTYREEIAEIDRELKRRDSK